MSRASLLLFLLLFFAAPHRTDAATPADAARAGGVRASSAVQVKLGDSAAALAGPWMFHTGDDPAWAGTDFDDSGWSSMDLTPPPGSGDAMLGQSGYLPGWTERGYPN